MSAADDKQNPSQRLKAEVKRAKVVRRRRPIPAERRSRGVNGPRDNDVVPSAPKGPEKAALPAQEEAKNSTSPAREPRPESSALRRAAGDGEEYVDKTVILPEDSFDYVVPAQTFKQHSKRKHSSTHRGRTKSASAEEIAAEEAGYIFTSSKKRKKHKKGHRHHRRRFRHLAIWKRILIIVAAVLLALIIALIGTYFVLNEIGRSSMHNYDGIDIVTPTEDESGNDIIQVDNSGRVITYDGVSYEFNEDIISVTFIGSDNGNEEYDGLWMGDAIYILTVDAKTGKVKILGISRDTMTDVDLYSEQGQFIDTQRMQLAFAFAYGNPSVSGGANTTKSLTRLFYGLPFDNYFSINLDALITLNDTLGGVTLTSSMTFVSPIDGRTINEGETVTLHGREAEYYVRYRDTQQLDSNNNRMQRQQEYIRAFVSSVVPAAKKDISVVSNLYNEIDVNSTTTLDLPKMTYIASTALTKMDSSADIEYINLTGPITEGEYAEMNVSNEETIRTMLDVFYTPLAEIPDDIR